MKLSIVKENLKAEAKVIRETKIELKEAMRNGTGAWRLQGQLSSRKREWRHKHIAYCLLKGRKLEEIEFNSWKAGSPSFQLIEKYKTAFAGDSYEG